MKHHITQITALLLLPFVTLHAAELRIAAVFSDHMVLQRDKPGPVWGWADPTEKITVEFAGQTKNAVADATGKWQVKLDPMTASAESRVLIIQSEKPARKLVHLPDRLPMLYHLAADPAEQNDLASSQPERVGSTLKELAEWEVHSPNPVFREPADWRTRHLKFYDIDCARIQPE